MPLAVRGRSPTGRLERSWGLWQEAYSARGQVHICSFVLLTLSNSAFERDSPTAGCPSI
jgi:hypothetical protein